jgi:hypothetical protein
MSVIARCAATPRICESANEVTRLHHRRGTGGERDRQQEVCPLLADDVVDEPLSSLPGGPVRPDG